MVNMLYYLELNESINFSGYERFLKLLSLEKQVQIHKFRFDIDKKLSLFSDLFVRYLACKALKLNNSDLIFERNTYGKPYLIEFPDFQYNISHTRSAIAIGLSDKPIGVDIEKIKPAELKIADRFFCKNECDYILSGNKRQDELFYEVWTKKEAYIKWVGKGLSMSLTSFDVTNIAIRTMLHSTEINGYIITICSNSAFDTDLYRLTENQVDEILLEFAT